MSALPILHRNSSFVVVDKPAGISSIPGRDANASSVRQELAMQLGQPVWVVHRLDRDTSGVLIFALTAESHRELSMTFEHGDNVKKVYWALGQGRAPEAFTVKAALVPARRNRMRVAKPGEAGKDSSTHFRAVECFSRATWLEAVPVTGRTHQIRVHLLSRGHGLLVDPQYGQPADWQGVLRRTPLHAHALEVTYAGERLTFSAPMPADMQEAIEKLRREG